MSKVTLEQQKPSAVILDLGSLTIKIDSIKNRVEAHLKKSHFEYEYKDYMDHWRIGSSAEVTKADMKEFIKGLLVVWDIHPKEL